MEGEDQSDLEEVYFGKTISEVSIVVMEGDQK